MTKLRHSNPPDRDWRKIYHAKQNAIDARIRKQRKKSAKEMQRILTSPGIPDFDRNELKRIVRLRLRGIKLNSRQYALLRKYRSLPTTAVKKQIIGIVDK